MVKSVFARCDDGDELGSSGTPRLPDKLTKQARQKFEKHAMHNNKHASTAFA
jgi:hypothetical protein